MYTNLAKHGGDFREVLNQEFSRAKDVTIASGYTSLDILHAYEQGFIDIARAGGCAKLLLGMAFYEGLGQKKLDKVLDLNTRLGQFGNESGVYVTNGRRYHGKVYHFKNEDSSNVYVGSSNFSSSGTKGNIECTILLNSTEQKDTVVSFLNDLYSPRYSIKIDLAEITVPNKKKIILDKVKKYWSALETYDPSTISTAELPRFTYSLSRATEVEKSNLNIYFGKGRWNKKTNKTTPRAWYEIELIARRDLNSQDIYPKGDFLAYTNDGLIIPMRTQGANFKNIRSKKSLQIFGIWLKGKLEKAGALKKHEPVTLDVLEEYGKSDVVFYKIDEGKYYLEF